MRRLVGVGGLLLSAVMVELALLAAGARIPIEGWSEFLWGWGFAEVSITVNFAVVGGVLAFRRPANPIGWLLLVGAWQAASSLLGVDAVVGVPWAGVLAATFILVPHGRTLSRFWTAVLGVVTVLAAAASLSALLALEIGGQDAWDLFERPLVLAGLPIAVIAPVLRYRRGTGVERLQLRALAAAGVFSFVALFVSAPLGLLPIVNGLAIPAVAWGLVVAVLRYRLYDIDRVISRTVSYTVLSIVLGGVYMAVVFAMQAVLQPVTTSDLAVALGTLSAAALFAPLRRSIQRLVDRRFNRARFDAAATVASFSADLRDELEAEALVAAMREVVARSVEPSFAWVWTVPRERSIGRVQ